MLKTYIRRGQQVILQSENPKYPPRYILEGDEFEVWGVVCWGLSRLEALMRLSSCQPALMRVAGIICCHTLANVLEIGRAHAA